MARYLSDLMKEILIVCYENWLKDTAAIVDTSAREVLVELYKFAPNVDINGVKPGALVFNREDIGVKRYQSSYVSVCRCFSRLVKRGLAIRKWNQGIKLTQKGIESAQKLLRF